MTQQQTSAAPAPAPKPATKALSKVDELKQGLAKVDFSPALPKHVTEEKFRRVLMTAIMQTPDLAEADRTSVYAAAMKAAQDGLLPDGREAALVIFRGKEGPKAQYMPMFAGILKKVRNSGELASITAQIVCKNDPFTFWVDEKGEHLKHEPNMLSDRGEMVGVYAVAVTKDGASYIDVMPKREIDKVRAVSRAKDSGPWVAWYDEMAKKSVIRRLSKRLPMSTDMELAQVLEHDNENYDLEPDAPEAPEQPAGRPTRLGKVIEATAKPANADALPLSPIEQPAQQEAKPAAASQEDLV